MCVRACVPLYVSVAASRCGWGAVTTIFLSVKAMPLLCESVRSGRAGVRVCQCVCVCVCVPGTGAVEGGGSQW